MLEKFVSARELETVLVGSAHVDVQDWRRHSVAKGFEPPAPQVPPPPPPIILLVPFSLRVLRASFICWALHSRLACASMVLSLVYGGMEARPPQ